MPQTHRASRLLLALLLTVGAGAVAEQRLKINGLTPTDVQFMSQQRQRIDELARIKLGRQLRVEKDNDLEILQVLLDQRLVRPEQKLELQAMGVIIGDLLQKKYNVKWVVYEDHEGRTRALQMGGEHHFLFPITMISRRAEVGAKVDVEAIYAKAALIIELYRPRLPFS